MKVHTASCFRRNALRHGFTLFELLLTLVILLMVTAIATPKLMHRLQRNEIQTAATSIRNHLNDARRRAVESGVPQLAVIDTQQQQVSFKSSDENGPDRFEPISPLSLPAGIRIAVSSNASSSFSGSAQPCCVIRFQPNGTTSSGSLTLYDAHGALCRLSIDRATGTIRLENPAH